MGNVVTENNQAEALPISASTCSKTNNYIVTCQEIGQRRHYPVCLNLIEMHKNRQTTSIYSDCMAAISKGKCPALKMRKEEIEADKAIYFHKKEPFVPGAITFPTFNFNDVPTVVEPEVTKDNGVSGGIAAMDYSQVINEAIKKESQKPKKQAKEKKVEKPAVKTTPKDIDIPAVVPGESLLAMAKRMLAERQSKEVSNR